MLIAFPSKRLKPNTLHWIEEKEPGTHPIKCLLNHYIIIAKTRTHTHAGRHKSSAALDMVHRDILCATTCRRLGNTVAKDLVIRVREAKNRPAIFLELERRRNSIRQLSLGQRDHPAGEVLPQQVPRDLPSSCNKKRGYLWKMRNPSGQVHSPRKDVATGVYCRSGGRENERKFKIEGKTGGRKWESNADKMTRWS